MFKSEIEELEKKRIEYLEADMNREAGKIQAKIDRLKVKQELKELGSAKKLKASLDRAESFIYSKGMYAEYNMFSMKEEK